MSGELARPALFVSHFNWLMQENAGKCRKIKQRIFIMNEFQKRVVAEKEELDKKVKALSNFIGLGDGGIFESLDSAEQERLKDQCEVMWQYSEILGWRIANF